MSLMDLVTAVLSLIFGLIIGAMAVGIAEGLGFAGWLAGVLLVLLALGFLFLGDLIRRFEWRIVYRIFPKLGGGDDAKRQEKLDRQGDRRDYTAFAIGAILGSLISVIWSPSIVFALLPP